MNEAIRNKLAAASRNASFKQRRADIVLDFVKGAIADGTLKPGDQLPTEFEIAAALGISRTPVREAMRVLQTIGLLEITAGAGTFVRAGVTDSFSELYLFQTHLNRASVESLAEVRRIFEGACAELAAQRASASDLAAMRSAIDALEVLHHDPEASLDAIVDTDLAFHRAVYDASGNPLLATISNFVLTMLRPWVVETQRRHGPAESIELHRAQYAAIAAGESGAEPVSASVRNELVRLATDMNMAQWLAALTPGAAEGAAPRRSKGKK
jgi:GntR family transcriptional repressor for pyruvate dehydrogenase complex